MKLLAQYYNNILVKIITNLGMESTYFAVMVVLKIDHTTNLH